MDKKKNTKLRRELKALRKSNKLITEHVSKVTIATANLEDRTTILEKEMIFLKDGRVNRLEQSVIGLEAMMVTKLEGLNKLFEKMKQPSVTHEPVKNESEDVSTAEAKRDLELLAALAKVEEAKRKEALEQNKKRKDFIESAKEYVKVNKFRLVHDLGAYAESVYMFSSNPEKRESNLNTYIHFTDKEQPLHLQSHKSVAMREDVFNTDIGNAICLAKALIDRPALSYFSTPPKPSNFLKVDGMVMKKGVVKSDCKANY